jgi:CubicO group peptidase (beta-lactamase class C family)
VVVLQQGEAVVQRGFGYADLARSIAARDDTPYPIGNLTETIGAALTLRQCMDFRHLDVGDRIVRWTPFPEPSATFADLLGHVSSTGTYRYDPNRFAVLGEATAECAIADYPVLVGRLFEQLAMTRSVPGREAADGAAAEMFSSSARARYRDVLSQVAAPYRVSGGTATRSEPSDGSMSASWGVISTAADLAKFDRALDAGDVVSADVLAPAWRRHGDRPTGYGWFVQDDNNGTRLVWHFGVVRDAYSALMVKVPDRRVTLIMLANSDRLAAPISTAQPDVTQSVFVKAFLRIFAD